MDPQDRSHTLYDFRKGLRGISILIGTSVCARGLDVPDIGLVVNFSCPNSLEDYIHRVGRTGRARSQGLAFTFITEAEEKMAQDLIEALKVSEQKVPESLIRMKTEFDRKVKCGEADGRKGKAKGEGFKFDTQE